MAELRWGVSTDNGRVRQQNEDRGHASVSLFIVADGMGGHLAGEVASEMTVTAIAARMTVDDNKSVADLVSAINDVNRSIFDASLGNPDQAGMGTTVVAIAVVKDQTDGELLGIANVGDSRGYIMRHQRLQQVTVDHSLVQELVAAGEITRQQARIHPRRNIVTRALGIEPEVRVDSWTMPIIQGDRFVLCSDGLVDEVDDDRIASLMLDNIGDPQATADALVEAANSFGGHDNITVIVIDVIDGASPPDPTDESTAMPIPIAAQVRAPAVHSTDADETVGVQADQADLPAGDIGRKRRAVLTRLLLTFGATAVVVLGFSILAAWARSGYYIAFDRHDQVVVYQGRSDGVLWFDPTRESVGQYGRDVLDQDSIDLVDAQPKFESHESAVRFVKERLTTTTAPETTAPKITTTTVSTTTTVP